MAFDLHEASQASAERIVCEAKTTSLVLPLQPFTRFTDDAIFEHWPAAGFGGGVIGVGGGVGGAGVGAGEGGGGYGGP